MDVLDLNVLDLCDGNTEEMSNLHAPDNKTTQSSSLKVTASTNTIRSQAVVTYSAAKRPPLFSQLAPSTNLNLAPANWLRNASGLRPNAILSGSRSTSVYGQNDRPLFTSFQMADSHLNYVGIIDVVSDAENLKKLLKVPYSKAHVGMAIHRIGNTLLLENFDINHISLKHPGWKWFNDMYKQLSQKGLLKKKLPSAQLDRLMLSKFLYYSVHQEAPVTPNKDNKSTLSIEEIASFQEHLPRNKTCSQLEEAVIEAKVESSPDSSIIPADLRWKYGTPDDAGTSQCHDIRNTFERTISWTFEDLQMLLGTNMSIFGGGDYPAVSLRLMDSSKPINVLTGIDYWLDNLICNVPEVVMCFHVNGIVQKYEVIKTDEIPKIATPKFNPQVIKDIAQNILSFLKSNCTKEGHTYWLFKGSNDDVVKLYDLTSLCTLPSSSDQSRNDAHNPFTISVATLLFKMAVNMMKQQRSAKTVKQNKTIKKLLNNCVKLLERRADLAPVMLDAALCMLSTLYLPDSVISKEPLRKSSSKTRSQSNSISVSESNDTDVASDGASDKAEIAVIPSAKDLSIPEKFKESLSNTHLESSTEEKDSYSVALAYIVKGLNVFNRFSNEQSIPEAKTSKELLHVHMQMIRNTAIIYYAMAEQDFNAQQYGKSLRRIKVALLSYEYLEKLLEFQEQNDQEADDNNIASVLKGTTPPEFNLLLSKLLILCGDIQMMQCQWNLEMQLAFEAEYCTSYHADTAINKILEKNFFGVGEKYQKAIQPSSNYDSILESCGICFNTALDNLNFEDIITTKMKLSNESRPKDGKKKETNKVLSDQTKLRLSLNRKLGHVKNEQGALFLDKAVQLLSGSKEDFSFEDEQKLWKTSFNHFDAALKCFNDADDFVNQALVQSNLGRLMRVCAQSTAQKQDEAFTLEEQRLYDSAIEYYHKALVLQRQLAKSRKTSGAQSVEKHALRVSDNISWELSVAYFTLAQRLQDHPPLDMKSRDEVEKMILDLLNKSLKYCSDIWKKTDKHLQAIHQCAKVHSRLASLHYNSYRQADEGNKQRHLKTLAEVQYEKACSYYKNLSDSHMCEYLRVLLEYLALREQQLPGVGSPTTKVKLIRGGFEIMYQCIQPLTVLSSYLKINMESLNCSNSSSVDPQNHSNDFNNFSEWKTLVDILATICQSLLLSFVKASSHFSNTTRKKAQNAVKLSSEHVYYKQIYSKSLHLFHKAEILELHSASQILLEKMEALLLVIQDLKAKN